MKKMTKKLFIFIAATILVVAAMAVSVAAYIPWDEANQQFTTDYYPLKSDLTTPLGGNEQTNVIDRVKEPGWYLIAFRGWTMDAGRNPSYDINSDGDYYDKGDYTWSNNNRVYVHPETGTLVYHSIGGDSFLNKETLKNDKTGNYYEDNVYALLDEITSWTGDLEGTVIETVETYKVSNYVDTYKLWELLPDLKTVKIDGNCTGFGANAFKDAENITIDMRDVNLTKFTTVDENAFTGATNITILAKSSADAADIKAKIRDNTSITYKTNWEGGNPLTFGSLQTKTYTQTGLRACFDFEPASLEAADFVRLGVLAISEENYATYGNAEDVVDAIGSNEKIRHRLIEGTFEGEEPVRKYTKIDGTEFCLALIGIPGENIVNGKVVFIAYAEIGDQTYTATNATADYGIFSLYDVTLGLFKQGKLNSQTCIETKEDNTTVDHSQTCLWDVLEKGAVELAVDGTSASLPSGATRKYTLSSDNKFQYLNVPLYPWSKTGSGTSEVATGLDTSKSTNVTWSLLKDGDNYVAVYRKAANATGDAYIPGVASTGFVAKAAQPYDSAYFSDVASYTNKDIYSPALSASEEAKVKTVVVDYGISRFESGAFQAFDRSSSSVVTFVYPEGVSAGTHLFFGQNSMKCVIFASKGKTTYISDKNMVTDVVDLSGFSALDLTALIRECDGAYMILPQNSSAGNSKTLDNTFFTAPALKRIWVADNAMPTVDGIADFTGLSFEKIGNYSLYRLSSIEKIIMPESFIGLEKSTHTRVFGAAANQVAYNIVVQNETAYNSLVDHYTDIGESNQAILTKISLTYNGVTTFLPDATTITE